MPDEPENDKERLRILSSKGIEGARARNNEVRNYVSKRGLRNFFEVRDDDSDPKLAEVKKAFNEMLEHPIAAKFKRNKVRLYLDCDWSETINLKALQQDILVLADNKRIIIPAIFTDTLDANELKACVAHEIGHHLRADIHPRNTWWKKDRDRHASEKFADKISVFLAQDPESLISSLEKMYEQQKKQVEDVIFWRSLGDPSKEVSEKVKFYLMRKFHDWLGPYPEFEKRKALIRETGERLKTPESKQELLAEIEAELLGRHQKLFPHHFGGGIRRKTDEPSLGDGMER